MGDVVRLEEFTGSLHRKIAVVFEGGSNGWLPTEFMAAQYITRILVAGRSSPSSATLASSSDWTQVWRAPGATEWSCLLGILHHLPGPVLIVIGPDVAVSPKILSSLRTATDSTVILLRSPSNDASTASYATAKAYASQSSSLLSDHMDHNSQVFFPVMDGSSKASHLIMNHLNDWIGRVALDIKSVLPSLASAGYGLTITDGTWYWYNPVESAPMSALTVAQVGRQIQVLGSLLESLKDPRSM